MSGASEQLRLLYGGIEKKADDLNPVESLKHAREVYKRLLSRFTGSYSYRDMAVFKFSETMTESQEYRDLVNDPSIKVLSEDKSFSVEEIFEGGRDGGRSKTPCVIITVSYLKVNIDEAFDKMENFLIDLRDADPPVTNPSVLNELLKAWEFFSSEVPSDKLTRYYRVQDTMKEVYETIKERAALPDEDTVEDILYSESTTDVIPDRVQEDEPEAQNVSEDLEMSDEIPETAEGVTEDVSEVLEGLKEVEAAEEVSFNAGQAAVKTEASEPEVSEKSVKPTKKGNK